MRPERLRCAVVLRVAEDSCEVHNGVAAQSVRFAPQLPSPRGELDDVDRLHVEYDLWAAAFARA